MNKQIALYTTMFLILSIIIVSCGRDEDITGKYQLIEISKFNCVSPADNFVFDFRSNNCIDVSGINFCAEGFIELRDNGVYHVEVRLIAGALVDFVNTSGTYSYTGSEITFCENGECQATAIRIDQRELEFITKDNDKPCLTRFVGKK